jgi:stage IV sporulation protein B
MKYRDYIRNGIGIMLLITFLFIPFSTSIQTYLSIPNQVTTFNNSNPISVPAMGNNVTVRANDEKVIQAIDTSSFDSVATGKSEIVYEMAGMPIKKVNVEVLKDLKIVPGGQSIGVKLNTLGVLVVGHHLVKTKEGKVSPGEEAGIKVGDIILEINGEKVSKMDQVTPIVKKAGKNGESLQVKVKRGEKTMTKKLTPYLDQNDETYRIGLYIRDSAAGIGTMTFYHPESKKYGALGHVISDMDTKKPIQINNGTIVQSNVTSIDKGNNGVPGEKQAEFSIEKDRIGTITKNSPFGIFGKLDNKIKNGKYDKAMPIALSHQVKEGPAKILTVLEGEKVREFDVEIVSSVPQKFPATKGLIVKITDKELLNKTGGIVQGMSGSPIIQDGKIVGAVTHVFVNDPTSGYGVYIEWMLQEAGINVYKGGKKEAS